MKRKSGLGLSLVLTVVIICAGVAANLSGCMGLQDEWGKFMSSMRGREAIIRTYDEESNIIDQINGKSIDISSEMKFNIGDGDGAISSPSAVLNITVGGHQMFHVGSTLILSETGIVNYFDEYAKTYDIENHDRSVPFINKIKNAFINEFSGKSYIILVRSQSGKPLATYAGNKVSIFATGIDKSTGILIDGNYLFVYRCDYTIYETVLINS